MTIWERLYAPFLWLHKQSFLGRIRVMALMLSCFTPIAYWNSMILAERSAAIDANRATATAMAVRVDRERRRQSTWVRYKFVDRSGAGFEGSQYYLLNGRDLKPGGQIQVFYNAENPRLNTIDRQQLRLEATRKRDASWIFLYVGLLAMIPYGRLWQKLHPA